MRASPLLRGAALVSLLAAGGGCVRQDPPRLAAVTLPEAEAAAPLDPVQGAPVPQGPWRLRYTHL